MQSLRCSLKRGDDLTNEQLVLRIKAGENTAANMLKLWEQNKGMIYKIALKFKGQEEIEDLVQQGYLGLYDAVENYDTDSEALFLSYATYWIKQSIQRYIENSGHMVRIPVHRQEDIRKYKKAVSNFEMKWNRKPTDGELSALLGVSIEKLDQIRKSLEMGQITSLDEYIKDSEETTVGNTVANNIDIEEQVIGPINQQEVKEVLWNMVDELPEDYPLLLKLRYQEGKTYKIIGETLGVTGDAIRQKEARAIKELSRTRRKKILAPYVDGYIKDMSIKGTGVEHFRTTWTSATERTALKLLEKEYRYAKNLAIR